MAGEDGAQAPTAVSLFSGIGGMDAGLARAGFRHLLLCESEPYRRAVLRARFPGVPVMDDVRAVACRDGLRDGQRGSAAAESWQRPATPVDLVAGGSPCQDLSVAGNRAGLAGDRSGLFFEYARIVGDVVRPRWFLFENVPGLLSSNGGRDFGVVLGTLADLGYGLAWRILDSRYFGVPQRRRRVFVVGARADGDPRAAVERAGKVLAVGSRCGRHPATRGEAREDVAGALTGRSPSRLDDACAGGGQLIAHALTSAGADASEDGTGRGTPLAVVAAPLSHGSNPNSNAAGRRREDDENLVAVAVSENQRGELLETTVAHQLTGGGGKPGQGYSAVREGASVRRLTPGECEALQSLPRGWTDLGGTADSPRYAALGDAVTANVAHWLGSRIIAAA